VEGWIGWVYLGTEWLIRLVMLPIVLRRRRPASAMSWLLVIFLLPWLGLVIYGLMGRQRLGRFRTQRAREAHRAVWRRGLALAREKPHMLSPEVRAAQRDFVAVARRLGESPILGKNAVKLFSKTDDVVRGILADIDAAANHVHVLMYIFSTDGTGRLVADALERAALRGVRCRVLADGVGSRRMLKNMAPGMRRAGVEVVELLPVNIARLMLSRLDIRNHRKIVIIDGKGAWTGSQNIVNADYGQRRCGAWRDVMLQLRGPIVLTLQRVFIEDWYAETGELLEDDALLPEPEEAGDVAAQIVSSGPHGPNRALQDLYLAAMQESEQRIVITSPYFVPDEPVISALRVAVMRGMRVDLVVPAKGNHRLAAAASRSYLRELVEAGVHVHLHAPGLLHAKTMTIDDSIAMLGSSNFDVRSFEINYELNLLLYGPDATRTLRSLQEHYIGECKSLTLEQVKASRSAARMRDDLARLLSPLL